MQVFGLKLEDAGRKKFLAIRAGQGEETAAGDFLVPETASSTWARSFLGRESGNVGCLAFLPAKAGRRTQPESLAKVARSLDIRAFGCEVASEASLQAHWHMFCLDSDVRCTSHI